MVLADLALDAPLRALHGIDPGAPGLPDLLAETRFGVPGSDSIVAATAPCPDGYRVLPGLRHHADWVLADHRSATAVLDALTGSDALVVAHVDRDVEGEDETGSLDIEDRNAFARAVLRRADLVVIAARDERADRISLIPALASLAAFGIPARRTAVVLPARVGLLPATSARRRRPSNVLRLGRGPRADLRLGAAIRDRLAVLLAESPGAPCEPDPEEPQRIEPGTLGAVDQAIDGWITPRTPQQP